MNIKKINVKRMLQIFGLATGICLTGCQSTENKEIELTTLSTEEVEISDLYNVLATFDRQKLQEYGKDFIFIYDIYEKDGDIYKPVGTSYSYESESGLDRIYSLNQIKIVDFKKGKEPELLNQILLNGEWVNVPSSNSNISPVVTGAYEDYVFEYGYLPTDTENVEKRSESIYSFSFSEENLLSAKDESRQLLGMYAVERTILDDENNITQVVTANGVHEVSMSINEITNSNHNSK